MWLPKNNYPPYSIVGNKWPGQTKCKNNSIDTTKGIIYNKTLYEVKIWQKGTNNNDNYLTTGFSKMSDFFKKKFIDALLGNCP